MKLNKKNSDIQSQLQQWIYIFSFWKVVCLPVRMILYKSETSGWTADPVRLWWGQAAGAVGWPEGAQLRTLASIHTLRTLPARHLGPYIIGRSHLVLQYLQFSQAYTLQSIRYIFLGVQLQKIGTQSKVLIFLKNKGTLKIIIFFQKSCKQNADSHHTIVKKKIWSF